MNGFSHVLTHRRFDSCCLAFLAACACLAAIAASMNAWSSPKITGVGIADVGVVEFVAYAISQV